MAFPTLVTAGTQGGTVTSNSTTWTLSHPPNLVAGDLLIAILSMDGSGTSVGTWPSGWVTDERASTANHIIIAKKISDGTEDGTSFNVTGLDSEQGCWEVLHIQNWEGTLGTTFGVASSSGSVYNIDTSGTASTNPNPPNADPTNWGTEDTLWIAYGGSDHGNTTYTAQPSGYTTLIFNESGGAGGAGIGIAYKTATAASDDPGTFTTDASEEWVAGTIAVRPAPASPLTISPSSIASGEAVGSHTLVPQSFPGIIEDGRYASGSVTEIGGRIFSNEVTDHGRWANITGPPSAQVLIQPTSIASGESFGTPTLKAGNVNIQPSAITSAESVGTPTLLVATAQFIQPKSINTFPQIRDYATVVASAAQTQTVVPVPAGTKNGDQLIMVLWLSGTSPDFTWDWSAAGWDPLGELNADSSGSSRMAAYFKEALSEPASYTVDHTSGVTSAVMVALQGVFTFDPIWWGQVNSAAVGQADLTADVTDAAWTNLYQENLHLTFFGGRLQPNGSGATWAVDAQSTEVVEASSSVVGVANSSFVVAQEVVAPGETGSRTATASGVTAVDWITLSVIFQPSVGLFYYGVDLALLAKNTISPTAIPSDEAFGTPTLKATARILPTAIPSAEAVGSHTLFHGNVNILPSAIASAEAFGSHILKAVARILPTAIDTAEAVGSHTLLHGNVNILPSAIASAESVGSHTLKPTNVISPSAIASAESVGTPTLLAGNVNIQPTAIPSDEAFGTHSLYAIAYINPTAIPSDEAVGTPTLSFAAGAQTILPTAIDSTEAVGSHTLKPTNVILPAAIDSAEAFGSHTLKATSSILPTAIVSDEAVGSHTLKATATIIPSEIGSAESVGTPSLLTGINILPTAIPSAEAVGSHTLLAGNVNILPSAITSAEAVGTPTLVLSGISILPSAITSAEAFGSHTLIPGGVFIVVSAIDSAEFVGIPVLATGIQAILPTAIDSAEAFGTPTLTTGNVNIQPTAVDSAESVGTPSLVATAQIIVSGIPSSETFGTPTLYSIAYINPSAVPSDEAVGTPTLIAAAGFIYPSSIDSAEAFGTPSLIAGAVQIIPTSISSAESVSQPTLTSTATVSPTAIGSQEALGTPSIIPGAVTIQPNGVPTDENVGVPSLLAGGVTIQPTSISTEELFGLPEFVVTATIVPEGAASAEALGFPLLIPGAVTISPSGIPSQEAVGDPAFANVLVGWNWVSRSPGWTTTKNRGWD